MLNEIENENLKVCKRILLKISKNFDDANFTYAYFSVHLVLFWQWKSLGENCSWTHSGWRLWAISANLMSGLARKDARTAARLDRTSSSGMNDRGHPMLVPSRAIAHALQRRNDLWTRTDGCPLAKTLVLPRSYASARRVPAMPRH